MLKGAGLGLGRGLGLGFGDGGLGRGLGLGFGGGGLGPLGDGECVGHVSWRGDTGMLALQPGVPLAHPLAKSAGGRKQDN